MKIQTILSVFVLAIFTSCASTYIGPTITKQVYRHEIPGNGVLIFKLMQRLLPMAGHAILSSDPGSGMITTAPVEMVLDPDNCDCGTAMGLPVVKQGGIRMKVSFEVGVKGSEMIVNAIVTPDLSGALGVLYSGLDIVCVSKGKLEEQLAKNLFKSIKF